MPTMNSLGRSCAACGKEHKTSHIVYDPDTLLPYCVNPYICSGDHPNSPTNLIKRGSEKVLVNFATAQAAHQKLLLDRYDHSILEKIKKIVQKPITVRILDPDMAKFLIELQEQMGFSNISETVRDCVQTLFENQKAMYTDLKGMESEAKAVEAIAEVTEGKRTRTRKKQTNELTVPTTIEPNPQHVEEEEKRTEKWTF